MKAGRIAVAAAACALAVAAWGEDGYVQSDGTQYINLGYMVGPASKVEFDFAMVETPTGDARPIGARGGQNLRIYFGGSGGDYRFSFTVASNDINHVQSVNSTVQADAARHLATFDYGAESGKCTVSIDGYSKTFIDIPNVTATQPLIVFAENLAKAGIYSVAGGSTYYLPAKAKIYGVRISESGTEILNFVPCVKGGVAGLKETHTGYFHTSENQAAHQLAYGGDILEEKDDPYVWTPRNGITTEGETSAFLDTGYTVTPSTRVVLDYAVMTPDWESSSPWSEDPYIISTKANKSGDLAEEHFSFWMNGAANGGTFRYAIGTTGGQGITAYPIATAYNVRRTVSMSGSGISVATAGYTNFTAAVAAAKQVTRNLASYTLKIGSAQAGVNHYLPMKVYGLKIYEGDALVKDYVPFIENGIGGFTNSLDATDRLTSKTRTNYSQTVSDGILTNNVFDVGGSIAAAERETEAYLQFDGRNGSSLNTGYVVTKDTRIEMDYSLWNTKHNSQQFLFEQKDAATKQGIWARVYYGGTHLLSYSMCDNDNGTFRAKATTVKASNHRQTLTLDSHEGTVKIVRGGEAIYDKTFAADGYNYARTATACVTNLWIGGDYDGSAHGASMRLYSFKISESGELKRFYVPYESGGETGLYDTVTGQKLPLAGGMVSGAGYRDGDAIRELIVPPASTNISYTANRNTAVLRCLGCGAKSYEWYENGELMPGETGETLMVRWRKIDSPYEIEYSVRPVFSVFNEKTLGAPASATVRFNPVGMAIYFN